jgi:hypothetical protein
MTGDLANRKDVAKSVANTSAGFVTACVSPARVCQVSRCSGESLTVAHGAGVLGQFQGSYPTRVWGCGTSTPARELILRAISDRIGPRKDGDLALARGSVPWLESAPG